MREFLIAAMLHHSPKSLFMCKILAGLVTF